MPQRRGTCDRPDAMALTVHRNSTRHDPPRRRGVVTVITLLAVLLLAALVIFVLNLGQQVNRRIAAQTTADATAIAGSTWVARSLNTVARQNVSMTRYLALINVLDSIPDAVRFAHHEQSALLEAAEAQRARGLTDGGGRLAAELARITDRFIGELTHEVDQLDAALQATQAYDVRQLTWHTTPEGRRGQLWEALYAMDEANQSIMEGLSPVAHTMAAAAGEATVREDIDAAAVLLPADAAVPWRRGDFDDFRRPILHGILNHAVDDPVINRGPFDALFGWRYLVSTSYGGTWIPGSSDTASGGRGSVPIGRGAGGSSGGRWVGRTTEVTAYGTYGMFSHLMRRVNSFVSDRLYHSRVSSFIGRMAAAKRNYLWPGGAPASAPVDDDGDGQPDSPTLASIREPEWVVGYDQIMQIADGQPERIVHTAYMAIEIRSRFPLGHPQFLTDGSWVLEEHADRRGARLARLGGWVDPREWDFAAGVDKVVAHGWRDLWDYTVWFDLEIGIEPRVDADGNPIAQPVYRIDHFYLLGINVGEPIDVLNPYAGFDPTAPSAPAPTDLDHGQTAPFDDTPRPHLSYLAIAAHDDDAQAWRSKFDGGKPFPFAVAIAQAAVFNNHSWDLWTPMWHARLEPIHSYEQWTDLAADTPADQLPTTVDAQTYDQLVRYLEAAASLAEPLLSH